MRKARGAFFTPEPIAEFLTEWAIRDASNRVLEPSCGDAVFLRAAGRVLKRFGVRDTIDQLLGFDIHADSLGDAAQVLASEGLAARLTRSDFFEVEPAPMVDALIGNPPFIRFQGFSGRSRELALASAEAVGVRLSALASSWASFILHGARFLKVGGRLGMVLPAELLAVNYAAPVRQFLLEHFERVDVVVFDELVFAGIQADVVLLLAEGYRQGHSSAFTLHTSPDAESINLHEGQTWAPETPRARWTDALASATAPATLADLGGYLAPAATWGRTTSGVVTGANSYFVLSAAQVKEHSLDDEDLIPMLPSGATATATSISKANWDQQVRGRPGLLFRPSGDPGGAALRYIKLGEELLLHERYKCRVREPWWRVPVSSPPDFFISYMSGSTPRIIANAAGLLNLNSIHGMTVIPELRRAARVLPVLAVNSASLLSAELVGRTYGGGILKMEPSEAARWLLPSPSVAERAAAEFRDDLRRAARLVRAGDVMSAQAVADEVLEAVGMASADTFQFLRESRLDLVMRRTIRSAV